MLRCLRNADRDLLVSRPADDDLNRQRLRPLNQVLPPSRLRSIDQRDQNRDHCPSTAATNAPPSASIVPRLPPGEPGGPPGSDQLNPDAHRRARSDGLATGLCPDRQPDQEDSDRRGGRAIYRRGVKEGFATQRSWRMCGVVWHRTGNYGGDPGAPSSCRGARTLHPWRLALLPGRLARRDLYLRLMDASRRSAAGPQIELRETSARSCCETRTRSDPRPDQRRHALPGGPSPRPPS